MVGHLEYFREMLELLEDKLREYRMLTLNPREYDDRTVTLSQLDSLRRELIDTARTKLAYIIFGKVPLLPDSQELNSNYSILAEASPHLTLSGAPCSEKDAAGCCLCTCICNTGQDSIAQGGACRMS